MSKKEKLLSVTVLLLLSVGLFYQYNFYREIIAHENFSEDYYKIKTALADLPQEMKDSFLVGAIEGLEKYNQIIKKYLFALSGMFIAQILILGGFIQLFLSFEQPRRPSLPVSEKRRVFPGMRYFLGGACCLAGIGIFFNPYYLRMKTQVTTLLERNYQQRYPAGDVEELQIMLGLVYYSFAFLSSLVALALILTGIILTSKKFRERNNVVIGSTPP